MFVQEVIELMLHLSRMGWSNMALTVGAISLFTVYWRIGDKLDSGEIAFAAGTALVGYLINVCAKYFDGYRKTSSWIFIENRMRQDAYLQWGDAMKRSWGFAEMLTIEPGHVICRKVKHGNPSQFSDYPCAMITKNREDQSSNVTIILFGPNEEHHTKLYTITDDGIDVTSNPQHRDWHAGEMKCYQRG